MSTYFLINEADEILNSVIADTPELALLGSPPGTIAVTELSPEHRYPAQPGTVAPAAPLTKLTFLRRFTVEERIAIRASADPVITDFMALLDLAEEVLVDDPDVIAALNYLTHTGLLGADRANTILSAAR